MAQLPILLWPDKRLATACTRIEAITDDIHTLAADMLETMYAAPGRGLAAPQVGRLIRLFVMDATWKEGTSSPVVMVNPELVARTDETVAMEEGCLSIPGITTTITRPAGVSVFWSDLDGIEQEARLDGVEARIVQHEYDHLDGIVTFERLDPAARMTALAAYAA